MCSRDGLLFNSRSTHKTRQTKLSVTRGDAKVGKESQVAESSSRAECSLENYESVVNLLLHMTNSVSTV